MQVRFKIENILRGFTAILLMLSLLVSSTGVHIDFAFCGNELKHVGVMHKAESKSACCEKIQEDACCTTQEIVQQAKVFDYLVTSALQISPLSAAILCHFSVDLPSYWYVKSPFLSYIPPPPKTSRQSVFQVFLC